MASSIEAYGFKIPILVSPRRRDRRWRPAPESSSQAKFCRSARHRVRRLDAGAGARLSPAREPFGQLGRMGSQAVAEELAELRTLHFDLTLTGFDPKEIDELLAPRADEQTLESVA